jgi:hypothetical protein
MAKHKTPMLDQLESGPWPSFVSDMKQEAARAQNPDNIEYQIPVDVVEDLLGVMELSYEHGRTHWKHGGIVGVFSDTAAALSVATATSPLRSRAWPTFTPCASTSRAANSTPPNF